MALLFVVTVCAAVSLSFAAEDGPEPGADGSVEASGDIAKILESLPLRERVAQLMLVTLQGAHAPDGHDRQFLTRYRPGGVVIASIVKPTNAAGYIELLIPFFEAAQDRTPPFIGANLYELRQAERRPSQFFVQLPSLLAVSAAHSDRVTERLGELLAEHLDVMGFSLHLGPSLALPAREGSASIHNFGESAAFAADAGAALVQAFCRKDVAAVPMGFPGGAFALPSLDAGPDGPGGLVQRDALRPFKAAIEAGAPIIHVSNEPVPLIDPLGRPASLSAAAMTGVLRNELGFEGVILAGPMDGPGIARAHDPTEAAILALNAGADMIYWQRADQRTMKSIEKIVLAVQTGQLDEERLKTSLVRILNVKKRFHLRDREPPKTRDARKLEKRRRYPEASRAVERRSITMVRNTADVLPLEQNDGPIAVTGSVGVENLADALEEDFKFVSRQRIVTARYLGDIQDFEIRRIVDHVMGIRTMVVVFTDQGRAASQVRLVRQLREKGVRVVVVLLGYPKNVPEFVEAEAIVLAYCDETAHAQSIQAVADVLVGHGPVRMRTPPERSASAGQEVSFDVSDYAVSPTGRLPVHISKMFPAGLGLHYDPSKAVRQAEWDFGDGKRDKGMAVTHIFKEAGRYMTTLTVTDTEGEKVSQAFDVVVQ